MMKRLFFLLSLVSLVTLTFQAGAQCTQTGLIRDGINLTALKVNPTQVTGDVDASACNIAIYIDNVDATITNAQIHGANYFGIVVNGDAGTPSASITDSHIYDIHDSSGLSGVQHGIGIYFRAMTLTGSASGTISNDTLDHYNKGGIVLSGQGVNVAVTDNVVTGWGPSNQGMNGIQVGYGASASVMRNAVYNNTYNGGGPWSAGGILVVGGPCYGTPYTVNTRIMQNNLTGNDVGVLIFQAESDCSALPTNTQTNLKIVNNTISRGVVAVNCCGFDGLSGAYMAGVSDYGVNDKIITNSISGYSSSATPACGLGSCIAVDTTGSAKAKVQATKD